ncbi:MAG TPA: aryldialkylphosphatase, partial [Verrucomicrobiales bacterium]|nr:aryldialkylphosphatase [Verrucomicrobiales bacterium]
MIMTVRGPVPTNELAVILPHEHVTTDFIGAEKFSQPRYDRDAAFATILPHFVRLKERGVRGAAGG